MTMTRLGGILLLGLSLHVLPSAAAPDAIEVPDGFEATELARGLTGAAALTVSADGRIFVCEQTGTLRVVKGGKLLKEPFLSLKVDSTWERGLIGVALHPEFPHRPYLYVTYVAPDPYPHHRVSRFTARGDRAVPGSEVVLLKGDDQRGLGGSVKAGHQGGAIHFGKDGKLYISIGEQTAGKPSQNLDTFQGKILRINPDGSIPKDNPFHAEAKGKYRSIWARGLRNPYCFAIQPGTGRMFINDVGGSQWEEINEGVAGANYGWPHAEGPARKKKGGFKAPFYAYRHTEGKSIAGGAFYNPASASFPARYHGKFFFIDYMGNWIKTIDPDNPKAIEFFARNLKRPADLRVAPDGSLVVLNRNAWVKDDKFKPNTGTLIRIRYTGRRRAPAPVARKPRRPPPPVPRIVPAGGTFTGPVTVRIVTGGEDARYSTDGNEADTSPYRSPFRLDRSGSLVARVGGKTLRAEFTIRGKKAYGLPARPPLARLALPDSPQGDAPFLLSKTGVFTSLETLVPAAGFVPYEVNSPQWADGAVKRRWIALPEGARIRFSPAGAWGFPEGTVLLEHLELATDASRPARRKRLETRILVVGDGDGFGLAYRWIEGEKDAELVTDYDTEDLEIRTPKGVEDRFWVYHSGTDCRSCHTPNAGFVLGVNARQLNRPFTYPGTGVTDNQLRTWRYLQMFEAAPPEEEIPRLAKLAPPFDGDAPLEHRVRSYLDANCAGCHRPGGARASFDARFETPLEQCNIVDGKLQTGNLEIESARVVVPGDPSRSILLQRLKRLDTFRMPPLGRYAPDRRALALFEEWIKVLTNQRR